MHLQLTVIDSRSPGTSPVEVEVEATAGSTVGELAAALGSPTIWADGVPLDPATEVGTAPVLDGAAVTLGRREPTSAARDVPLVPGAPAEPRKPAAPSARAVVEVAVAHGPDAGRTVALGPGLHTVGRGGDAAIAIDDPGLSRVHAVLEVTADSITVADAGSTNGTDLDGAPADTATEAPVGTTIRVGASLLRLRTDDVVPAATTPAGDGTVLVNRRPRLESLAPERSVTVPAPPTRPPSVRLPWAAMVVPLPVAGVLAFFFGPTMLAFALTSPLMMVGTAVGDRLTSRRRYAAEQAAHLRHLHAAEETVRRACRAEEAARREAVPDVARILTIASTPTSRLWERRVGDTDFLAVGVGAGSAPAAVRVTRPGHPDPADPPLLHQVPCVLPLGELGVLGVCGVREAVGGLLRSLLGQLVTLHSPLDLRMVVVTGSPESARDWAWLGRLPHVRTGVGGPGVWPVAGREGAHRARAAVVALAGSVRDRRRGLAAGDRWTGPHTLLVLEDAGALHGIPELVEVLAHGPHVGVHVVAAAADRAGLPAETMAVLDLSDPDAAVLHRAGSAPQPVVADRVGPWWADRLSRSLAPLRDATPGAAAVVPRTASLLELLVPRSRAEVDDLPPPDEIISRWSQRPRSTSVPLGHGAGGPFRIDLATDGPHVLVAGTTGSGKSELLRTLVASLAVHNRPEHLSMVLVDYKGGAAFRDLADFPHVVGLVTDLDEHLAARVLVSLRAELKRRERVLADAGVSDFVAYESLPLAGSPTLARLVLLVDEFRALAEELPEFVDGMVSIASLGRSLGVHLVLATQRPAGVVTADIKANLNLRIGLRMRDHTDSLDVLEAPDAAFLDPATPGRALVRTGGGELTAVQVAHPGATTRSRAPQGVRVRPLPWGRAPDPWPAPQTADAAVSDDTAPDLAVVVAAVVAAAGRAGAKPPHRPWLPALPALLEAAELPGVRDLGRFPVGLVDEPAHQRQVPLTVALDDPRHWGFTGGPGSGRTTALLTVVGAAAAARGPDRLHVYAVSAGSLVGVESLPHCGAHVATDDVPRLVRLVDRLSAEVARRRSRPGTIAPALLLVVDDWERLADRASEHHPGGAQLVARLLGLLRDGAGVGLTAVVGGGRALLVGAAASALGHRVVLRVDDPTDLLLAGVKGGSGAAGQPPGRGLLPDGREVQLALPPALPPAAAGPLGVGGGPWRVDALPDHVDAADLRSSSGRDPEVLVGMGGDELRALGLDPLRDGRRWAVVGGRRSGVSTALSTITAGLLARGRPVCVVGRRGDVGWTGVGDDPRLRWCTDPGQVEQLASLTRQSPELAVVVDDADTLADTAVGEAVRQLACRVDLGDGLVVVGAHDDTVSSQFRGVAVEVARHATGILLGPASSAAAAVLGAAVPVDRRAAPGRGYLVRGGLAVPIQVASTTVRE